MRKFEMIEALRARADALVERSRELGAKASYIRRNSNCITTQGQEIIDECTALSLQHYIGAVEMRIWAAEIEATPRRSKKVGGHE